MRGLSSDLLKQTLDGGFFAAGIERLDQVQQVVAPDGVRLSFQVQGADRMAGCDVELQIDYAELEAMRCGCSPAEVFRGPVLQWSPHAEAWQRREVDGAVSWEHPRFGINLPDVEIRVWLSEAAERGYWDGELRVGALCGWHRVDRRIARELDKVKESLAELFVEARGGRGGYEEKKPSKKRPPLGERLIGWLTGQDDEPAGGGEVNDGEWRPYVPSSRTKLDSWHGLSTDAKLVLADVQAAERTQLAAEELVERLHVTMSVLDDATGATMHRTPGGKRRLLFALNELRRGPRGDAGLTGNATFDRRFWAACDGLIEVA